VLDRLESVLRGSGSGLDRLVKVNVYAARAEALPAFRAAFARRMGDGGRPAVSEVVGSLTRPEAMLGLDAVAVAVTSQPSGPRSGGTVAVLPAGGRVYVSGQAAPGADLAEATRHTLKGLAATLDHLGLDRSRVVQLKAFVQPISGAGDVEREMTAFFGRGSVPPLVFVEWRSGKAQPIEIELIAADGGRDRGGETVEYLTPPALKPSPLFSRVARVNRGALIYVSGLRGPAGASGAGQVEAIFEAMKSVLAEAGGDLRHLVKATYYVADDEAGRALNDLRPRYYDPKTPPAASKAVVAGVGAEGRSVTLDMIAVPAAGRTPE
jgi:enamine deaminase RidA (YjgF/YER057c/UK114 family)